MAMFLEMSHARASRVAAYTKPREQNMTPCEKCGTFIAEGDECRCDSAQADQIIALTVERK